MDNRAERHGTSRAAASKTGAASPALSPRRRVATPRERRGGCGEVLVSSTVKDLVAGSGLRFNDRGSHTMLASAEAASPVVEAHSRASRKYSRASLGPCSRSAAHPPQFAL